MINFDGKKYAEKKKNESGAMGLGLNYVAGVALFFFLGRLVDNHYDFKMTFQLVGLFLGLFGSTFKLLKDVKKLDDAKKN